MLNRVLLIEESGDVRSLEQVLLEIGGNEVLAVASPREGMTHLRLWQPSLVILNLRLPNLDAWDFFVLLRSRRPSLPVILTDEGPLTLPVSSTELRRWSASYLPRPFGADELFSAVEEHLVPHRHQAAS